MNCHNQLKALKERTDLRPGCSAAKPGVLRITIITAEQRDSFEITSSNEAVQLKVDFDINPSESFDFETSTKPSNTPLNPLFPKRSGFRYAQHRGGDIQ